MCTSIDKHCKQCSASWPFSVLFKVHLLVSIGVLNQKKIFQKWWRSILYVCSLLVVAHNTNFFTVCYLGMIKITKNGPSHYHTLPR